MDNLTEGIKHLKIPSGNKVVLSNECHTENESPLQSSPLLQLLTQYGVFKILSSHLGNQDFMRLKRLCNDVDLQANWSTERKTRWDVNERLLRFVDNPTRFRTELGIHDALIAGSFVIQFFDNVLWEEADLDVYVEDGDGARALCQYLFQNERYKIDPTEGTGPDHDYPTPNIVKVRTFVREDGDESRKVQVITTRSTPIQTILGDTYSTALVNFMTWNKAFSMFPALTFIEPRTMVAINLLDSTRETHMQKYRERGWKSVGALSNDSAGSIMRRLRSLDPAIIRKIGDCRTLKMELNVDDVDAPPTPDYVLEHCQFQVSKHWSHRIVARTLSSCLLKYKYTWSNYLNKGIRWHAFLRSKLDPLVEEEVKKLAPEWIPRGCLCLHDWCVLVELEKPADWKYYDHMIPVWWKEFDKGRLAIETGTVAPGVQGIA